MIRDGAMIAKICVFLLLFGLIKVGEEYFDYFA
jgi:hypothetical protein